MKFPHIHVQWIFLLPFLLASANLWAGPPFQTDDPEPVDFRHYEFYQFGTVSSTPVETDPTGPAFEFNWGVVPNVQLHVILPWGALVPPIIPYIFPPESAPAPTVSPTWNLARRYASSKKPNTVLKSAPSPCWNFPPAATSQGLGVGRVWYKLPIWVQKSWGHWTSYGGAGYQIVHQTQYRNFPYGGWLLQRDIGKRLTLGGEIFSHAREGSRLRRRNPPPWSTWAAFITSRIRACKFYFAMGIRWPGKRELRLPRPLSDLGIEARARPQWIPVPPFLAPIDADLHHHVHDQRTTGCSATNPGPSQLKRPCAARRRRRWQSPSPCHSLLHVPPAES